MNNYSHQPKDFIGKEVEVVIDRPLGSKHPTHKFPYPVNYGFIPGTKAPDGAEIDVYVLRVPEPVKKFKGTCIAVIHRTNDNDDKLVVVPTGAEVTDEEITKLVAFQEQHFISVIVR